MLGRFEQRESATHAGPVCSVHNRLRMIPAAFGSYSERGVLFSTTTSRQTL